MLESILHHKLGFWGAIHLLLFLWAIFSITQNRNEGAFGKALWVVWVACVPVIGFFSWLFFGPKAPKKIN
ncbi:MAG: PLDc N-terminal domain-containing protein [Caulobacterales bacterium]|nr:PLDc N-terminal domain-containing protein [Caulobacterales bacterium]MCA0371848.1 PLDc N-terminal domain-containing protein [Pseudomonadota bacterium]